MNIDDSNFQAKLTQMRASLDSTMGGAGGIGSFGSAMAYMGPGMGAGNFGSMNLGGGFASFGGQVAPVSFTPPAIAMQPHFGMFQVQQNLRQAGLAATFGPAGIAMNQFMDMGMSTREGLNPRISYGEYIGYSSRAVADRLGAHATAISGTGLSLGMNVVGGGIGTALGTMAGGFFGGLAGGIAGGLALGAVGNAAVERSADHLAIQSALSSGSFRFYQGGNPDAQTGRGFNRNDRFNIATNIMRMESNDNRFNTTDYKQMLEGGMQMDLFSGTRDADDFSKKFKDLVATVKTVSSTLHTSLKEGLEAIRGMRDMGVTDGVGQQSMVLRSETMGRMSGRTGMEMMAIGQTGAEMFRGTGVSMQRGFELNQQNTALVRQMLNTGAISRETVAQAGGELALAQHMTAGSLAGFQTLQGRGAMMAAFNPATGEFDPNMVTKMMGGNSMSIMAGAAGTMSNPANMFKFQAHQEELISKLSPMEMQMFGVAQRMASARTLQGAFGGDLKDIFMSESKRQGIGIEQIKTEIGMLTMDPAKWREQMVQQNMSMTSQQNLEAARDSYLGPKFLTNAFTRAVTQPLSEGMNRIGNRVSTAAENVMMDVRSMFGGNIDSRQLNSGTVNSARDYLQSEVDFQVRRAQETAGRPVTEDEAVAIARRAQGSGSVVDISESGFTDRVSRSFGGKSGTAQGDLLRAVKKAGLKDGRAEINGVSVRAFESKEIMEGAARLSGKTYLNIGEVDGQMIGVSSEDLGAIVDSRRKMQVSQEEIDKQRTIVDKNKDIVSAVQGSRGLDIGHLGNLVVKDFKMSKYTSGGYGKDVYARIRALADVSGDRALVDQIDSLQDTSVVERLRNEATGKMTDVMRSKRRSMGNSLQRLTGDGALGDLLQGDKGSMVMEAITMLDRGSFEGATQKLVGAGSSRQEAQKMLEDLEAAKKDPTKSKAFNSIAQNSREFLSLANQTATNNAIVGGSDAGAAGGIGGSLQSSQMEALMQMAKTLETQIKMLQTMQAQLSGSFKNPK